METRPGCYVNKYKFNSELHSNQLKWLDTNRTVHRQQMKKSICVKTVTWPESPEMRNDAKNNSTFLANLNWKYQRWNLDLPSRAWFKSMSQLCKCRNVILTCSFYLTPSKKKQTKKKKYDKSTIWPSSTKGRWRASFKNTKLVELKIYYLK